MTVARIDAKANEYKCPDELLFAVVDTTIVFISNSNEGSGDTDRGGGRSVKNYSMYQLVGDTIIFAVSAVA